MTFFIRNHQLPRLSTYAGFNFGGTVNTLSAFIKTLTLHQKKMLKTVIFIVMLLKILKKKRKKMSVWFWLFFCKFKFFKSIK